MKLPFIACLGVIVLAVMPGAGAEGAVATNSLVGGAVLAPPAPPDLPAPVREVVRLAQTTLGQTVLVDYVATIKEPYSLAADQIIYLRDLGVPDAAIQALLKHQLANPAANPAAPAPTAAAGNRPANPLPPAEIPAPTVAPGATLAGADPALTFDPSAAPVTAGVFQEALDPYGNWVDVTGYGLCWQPTVALINPNWRPYCDDGSWVWSDSGWYWRSGYSWGWAPFHYGRWHLATGRGWCWVPDTFWGPAWVTWRASEGYCGWAPLPPGSRWVAGVGLTWRGGRAVYDCDFGLGATSFVYLGWSNFADPRPWRYCLSRAEVPAVYRQTRPVNDIHSDPQPRGGGGRYSGVVNNGPGIKPVVEHSRGQITRVHLVDSPDLARTLPGHLSGRPVVGLNPALPVYRPSPTTRIVARPVPGATPPSSPASGVTGPASVGSQYHPAAGVGTGTRPAPTANPTVGYRQPNAGTPVTRPISANTASPNHALGGPVSAPVSTRPAYPPAALRPAPYYNAPAQAYRPELSQPAPVYQAEPPRTHSPPVQAPSVRVPAYTPPSQSNGNSGGGNSQPQRNHNQSR